MFAVQQLLPAPIFTIADQKIERKEAWVTTAEQQIPKLRPAPLVQAHDFAIEHGQSEASAIDMFLQRSPLRASPARKPHSQRVKNKNQNVACHNRQHKHHDPQWIVMFVAAPCLDGEHHRHYWWQYLIGKFCPHRRKPLTLSRGLSV
jgi:hypothetical protein